MVVAITQGIIDIHIATLITIIIITIRRKRRSYQSRSRGKSYSSDESQSISRGSTSTSTFSKERHTQRRNQNHNMQTEKLSSTHSQSNKVSKKIDDNKVDHSVVQDDTPRKSGHHHHHHHHHNSPKKTPRSPKKDRTPRDHHHHHHNSPRKDRTPRKDLAASPKRKVLSNRSNQGAKETASITKANDIQILNENDHTQLKSLLIIDQEIGNSALDTKEQVKNDTVTEESPLYRPGFPEKFQRRVSKNNVKLFPNVSSKSEENDNSYLTASMPVTMPIPAIDASIPIPVIDTSIPIPASTSTIPSVDAISSADASISVPSKKKNKVKASPSTKSLDGTNWVLVNDGVAEFYFNKETKAISFTLPDTTNDLETSVDLEASIDIGTAKMETSMDVVSSTLENSMDEKYDAFETNNQSSGNLMNDNNKSTWSLRRHNSARVLAVSEWEVHLDYESGHPFYYNTKTETSTWEMPEGLSIEQKQKLGYSNAWQSVIDRSHVTSTLTITADESNTCDWTVYYDPDSAHHFYHNTITNESTWEAPDSISQKASSKESNNTYNDMVRVTSFLSSKIGSWNAYMDDHKRIFYHHEKTNQTSWAPPILDDHLLAPLDKNRQKRLSFGDDDVISLHSIDDNMSNLGL